MVTGLNPGKHGIFWFTEDDPTTYGYRFLNGSYRRGKAMWRVLSDEGRRVCVVNVPMTFPAEDVNGVLVAGLDAPDVDDPRFTYPPEAGNEIRDVTKGEYLIHSGTASFADPARVDEGIERLHQSIDARLATAKHFMRTREWDFFMVVFTESDVVQHYFWRHMESPPPDEPEHRRRAIRDVYEHLDRATAELMASAEGDPLVVVVSDHGARGDPGLAGALQDWLAHLGHLSYATGTTAGGIKRAVVPLLSRIYRQLDKQLSIKAKHRLAQLLPRLRAGVETKLSYGRIDWSKTVAYSDGKRPEIWINLKGRQPQGVVEPDAYDELRKQIAHELTSARCAHTGEPLVRRVVTREEAYEGPYVERSPDLIVEWVDTGACLDVIYPGGRRFTLRTSLVQGDTSDRLVNGGHSQTGVVGLLGPGAQKVSIDDADIADIAPTILFALGAPIPEDVDGKVLTAALDPELAARAARTTSGSEPFAPGGAGYSAEEEAEVRERLQALGYVE